MPDVFDKARGVYFGGAIGDAMGGPVSSMTRASIVARLGRVEGLLPYGGPETALAPGAMAFYAHQQEAGTYTGETRGRNMLCQLILSKGGRVTADDFGRVVAEQLDPRAWWPGIMLAHWRIKFESMPPRDAGNHNVPGGGLGWFSPIGVVHAGDPFQAYASTFDVCSVLKRGIERELIAAVSAAVAEGFRRFATVDSVIDAARRFVSDEARHLIDRAVATARAADCAEELYAAAQDVLLHDYVARFQIRQDTRLSADSAASWDAREIVPMALAFVVFSRGRPDEAIRLAANFGRSSESIGTTVGAVSGALAGASGLPAAWIETVKRANPDAKVEDGRIDHEAMCRGLAEVSLSELQRARARARSVRSLAAA